MRIATWNVNGVRAREGYLRRWLADRKPDIVGLQKIRVMEDEFPYEMFKSVGYHAVAHCGRGEYGVAILSREEPSAVSKGLTGQEDLGARLVTVDAGPLSFSSVYAPYGHLEGIERKLLWLESLTKSVRGDHCPSRQRVLCGDFNVVQDDIDNSTGPPRAGTLCYSKAERRQFSSLLGAGLVDLYARRHPNGRDRFTYWNYRWNQDCLKVGVRLDLILGTNGLVDRLRAVWVDMDYRREIEDLRPSESAPVTADLDH